EGTMRHRLPKLRLPSAPLAVLALVAAGSLTTVGMSAEASVSAATSGTVLQTNLVSDLPGVAAVMDPHLVNAWGISESSGSPFWISDNNAGVSTLYQVPDATSAPVIIPLVVNIPTPAGSTGGTPTGTVFNTASSNSFQITGPDKSGHTASA